MPVRRKWSTSDGCPSILLHGLADGNKKDARKDFFSCICQTSHDSDVAEMCRDTLQYYLILYKNVTIWPRVQLLLIPNVPSLNPFVTLFCEPHRIAL